jgi:hypothetical protein
MRVNLEKSERTKATFIFDGWRPPGGLSAGDIQTVAWKMDEMGIPRDAKAQFINEDKTTGAAVVFEWEKEVQE